MILQFLSRLVYLFNQSNQVYDSIMNKKNFNTEILKSYASSAIWLTFDTDLREKFPSLVTAEGQHIFNGRLQKYLCTTIGLVLVLEGEDAEWLKFNAAESMGVGYLEPEVTLEVIKSGKFISASYGDLHCLHSVRYFTKENIALRDKNQREQKETAAKYEAHRQALLEEHASGSSDPEAARHALSKMFYHDYHYKYSDDIETYRRGRAERDWLEAEFNRLDIPIDVIQEYHTASVVTG